MWGRGKKSAIRPAADSEFGFLTEEQAATVRRLVQREFASAGVEVVPLAQHVEATDGRVFGLFDLAARCHASPGGEPTWPHLVREHVAAVLAIASHDVGEMSLDEVLPLVYPRLMGTTSLPPRWLDGNGYARQLGGDLVEVLAVDLPESVALLTDDEVRRLGEAELREAALANLVAMPVESHETSPAGRGAELHVVSGESFFTASKALVLQDLLARTVGHTNCPHGVVLAAPTRHQLVFHVVQDISVVAALAAMRLPAAATFQESPGGISPFVYWWRNGAFEQVTHVVKGDIQISASDEFVAVLNEMAEAAD